MKFKLLIIALGISFQGISQQQVSYSVRADDPEAAKKLEINLGALMIDFLLPYHEHLGVDVGINLNARASYYGIADRFGIDGVFHAGGGLIEIGEYRRTSIVGTYRLTSKSNTKDKPFELSRSTRGNLVTVKSLSSVPQTFQTNFEARGGMVRTRGRLGFIPYSDYNDEMRNTQHKSIGLVAGAQIRRFHYTKISMNGYTYTNSTAVSFYADLYLIASSNYEAIGTGYGWEPSKDEIRDAVKETNSRNPLGGVNS